MRFTVEEEAEVRFPDDSIHRARLLEIKLRTFTWTDRDGQEREGQSLDWWWEIVSTNYGDQFIGRKVKGECNAKITSRSDNRFRIWAGALLNRDIPIGMVIDTDDLTGLEADIVIGYRQDRKDKTKSWAQVTDVAQVTGSDFDPPF